MVHARRHRYGYDRSAGTLTAQQAAAERALALEPDLPEAHWAAGWVHYIREDFHEALDEFMVALEGAPNEAEVIADIGYAQRRLGNYPETFAAFERASKLDPGWPRLSFDLGGITFHRAHRWADAVEAYNRAFALAPDFTTAAWYKGLAYCSWQGQLDTLRAIAENTPGISDEMQRWLKFYERDGEGALTYHGQAPDRVIVDQGGVTTRSLYSGWAHQLLGDERAALAAFDSARVLLEQWEREIPGDPRVHYGLAQAYAGLGRTAEASRRAAMILEADPGIGQTNETARYNAAEVFAAAGLAGEAVELLDSLLAGPSRFPRRSLQERSGWPAPEGKNGMARWAATSPRLPTHARPSNLPTTSTRVCPVAGGPPCGTDSTSWG
jgi:tetratricopeptide (TPR) repeat protein